MAAVNRQCNGEGAAKGGSLGATTEAAMAVHGPVPKGYGEKSACHRGRTRSCTVQKHDSAEEKSDYGDDDSGSETHDALFVPSVCAHLWATEGVARWRTSGRAKG